MKQLWLFVLMAAAANAMATEAAISSVTLYPGGATIERTIQVAPGMTSVEVGGLPANFRNETIRVQADEGIQVGQIVTRDQSQVNSPSAREAELETKIQTLQDQIGLLDADYKSAKLVVDYLERLGVSNAAGDRAMQIDGKTMLATLDAIRKGSGDALERMHKDEISKRALDKQVQALKRDLERARIGSRENRTVTISLAARQAGKLTMTYQVNNAGWKPTYRAALDSTASNVEIERLAIISQKTGEDWSNVKMRLSTGQPRLSPQAPNPSSWLLSYQPPRVQEENSRQNFAMAPAPAAAPAARYAPGAADDDYVAPVIETQGNFSTDFDVPARVTLPSDGREISVGLSKQTLAAKQKLRVVPRLEQHAVVTAEAARPQGVWLPGPIQLFRDGAYVGSTNWNTQDSKQFVFSFGRDTLLRVAVEHRNEKAGGAGFLNRDNERRIEDTYAITSFHRQPVELQVLEASPVSESDKIDVKTGFKPEPTIKDWEGRRGIIGWEQTINPNDTLRFNVDYRIAFPKEGFVRGLP